MSGRFGLPCPTKQDVTLLSIGELPGGFPRFSGHSLQPLAERHTIPLSIALDCHGRLLKTCRFPEDCGIHGQRSLT
jgi:hypothetical protein